jgi:hypothetical protein
MLLPEISGSAERKIRIELGYTQLLGHQQVYQSSTQQLVAHRGSHIGGKLCKHKNTKAKTEALSRGRDA